MPEGPLQRVRAIALGLPEADAEAAGRHVAFRVPGKTFAWYLDDHHGDGMIALNVKADPGENERLTEADPGRYFKPSYLGSRGWVGVRLDTPRLDWNDVEARILESYRLIAPRRLGAQLDA